MNPQASAYYHTLINDQKLMPLSAFKSNKFSKYNLFPHAQTLPAFFQSNLQSDGRVVKFLKGPEGAFRGFYYQLFKLGFQIQNSYKDYPSIIKNAIFNPKLTPIITSPMAGKQYSISQYQRIIAQFIKIMESQVIPNAELTFSQYPIIDQAMLTILSFIFQKAQAGSSKKIDNLTDLMFKLCEIFQITLKVYDNCYSFQESDVFLYAESSTVFYLAFLSEMAEVQSYEQTSESPMDPQFKEQMSSNSYIQSKDQLNIYRDIRLSAGNKGTRAKVMNRSVRQTKTSNFATNSFGGFSTQNIFEKQNMEHKNSAQQQQNKRIHAFEQQYLNKGFEKNVFESNIMQQKQKPKYFPFSQQIIGNQGYDQDQQVNCNQKVVVHHVDKPTSKKNSGTQEMVQNLKNNIIGTGKKIQSHQLIVQENAGLNLVFESIDTYKSISDSLPQNSQRQVTRKTSEKDIMSKFGRHQVSQSIQYDSVSGKDKSLSGKDKQIKQPVLKSQINMNNQTYKYQFKSYKYKFHNMNDLRGLTSKIEPIPENPKQGQKQEDKSQIGKKISSIENQKNLKISPSSNHKLPLFQVQEFQAQKAIKKSSPSLLADASLFHKNKFLQQEQNSFNRVELPEVDIKFYNPFYKNSSHNCSMPIFSTLNTLQTNLKARPDNLLRNGKNQDTLGTFYRQFSDTKVMQAMQEPFRTKVRTTRQKFKGIRSKNWKGFF